MSATLVGIDAMDVSDDEAEDGTFADEAGDQEDEDAGMQVLDLLEEESADEADGVR
jgi:hypothetical protein